LARHFPNLLSTDKIGEDLVIMKDRAILLMELCQNGDLARLLLKSGESGFDQKLCKNIFAQICQGINTQHKE